MEIPTITEEMLKETAVQLGKRRRRKLKGVKGVTCPTCGQNRMDSAEDLVFDCHMLGERIVIPNLSGLRCGACGEQAFDAPSSRIIDEYTREKVVGGYECRVSTVGAGKLGLYFPRDVLRTMDIKPKARAIIKPLTRRKMIVEL